MANVVIGTAAEVHEELKEILDSTLEGPKKTNEDPTDGDSSMLIWELFRMIETPSWTRITIKTPPIQTRHVLSVISVPTHAHPLVMRQALCPSSSASSSASWRWDQQAVSCGGRALLEQWRCQSVTEQCRASSLGVHSQVVGYSCLHCSSLDYSLCYACVASLRTSPDLTGSCGSVVLASFSPNTSADRNATARQSVTARHSPAPPPTIEHHYAHDLPSDHHLALPNSQSSISQSSISQSSISQSSISQSSIIQSSISQSSIIQSNCQSSNCQLSKSQSSSESIEGEVFECPICMEDVLVVSTAQLSQCGHRYCRGCLSQHLNVAFSRRRSMLCPTPSCKQRVALVDVQAHLSQQMFALFLYVQVLLDLRKQCNTDCWWCPTIGCSQPCLIPCEFTLNALITCPWCRRSVLLRNVGRSHDPTNHSLLSWMRGCLLEPADSSSSSSPPALSSPSGRLALTSSIDGIRRPETFQFLLDIVKAEPIGTGVQGEVFRGVWSSVTTVVLKSLRLQTAEFFREAAILESVKHPNCVDFFGLFKDGDGHLYMVTEMMSQGSLKDLLHNCPQLSAEQRLHLCQDITAGIEYLHRCSGIIHRDIAARNVLVRSEDGRYKAKLGDFGLSRKADAQGNYVETSPSPKPVPWLPPEALQQPPVYSFASDIWSLGVTFYEIFTNACYPLVPRSPADWQAMLLAIRAGHLYPERPGWPASPYSLYQLLMMPCWDLAPRNRVTARKMQETISFLLFVLPDIDQQFCMDSAAAVPGASCTAVSSTDQYCYDFDILAVQ